MHAELHRNGRRREGSVRYREASSMPSDFGVFVCAAKKSVRECVTESIGERTVSIGRLAAMIYRFLDFELDNVLFELRRGGGRVPLEPRVLDLLNYLIRNHHRVISPRELREQVWDGVVVSDAAITRAVKKLRSALDEPADGTGSIRTVRGRGYRFAASLAEPAPDTPRQRVAPPRAAAFVGREGVLESLGRRFARARAGGGGVALLCGEPGIGKTRTAEEFARVADATGARVLLGRGYEGNGAPPFWPWSSALRELVSRDDVPGVNVRARRALKPLLHDASASEPAVDRSTGTSDEERFAFFDAVSALLRDASRVQPVLVVLDDLHWADEPSLLLLTFAAHEIRRARVLLLGTHRPPVAAGPLARTVASLERVEPRATVVLNGLGRDAIAAFVHSSSGRTPDDSAVEVLEQRTGGNPLFLIQLSYSGFDGDLPRGVLEAIERHLDVLTRESRRVLAIASVFGRTFSLPLVSAAARIAPGPFLDVLDEARAAGVVVPSDGGVSTWQFAHGLVRDALYASLSARERGALHAASAEALAAQHKGDLAPHLAALAYHFNRAAPVGYVEQAVAYATSAAVAAASRLAYETAAELYEQALGALEFAPDPRRRLDLLMGLGSARARSADYTRSRVAFEEAAELAESLGLADALGRAAFAAAFEPETGAPDLRRITLLERALGALGDAPSATVALCMSRLAGALWADASSDRRLALSQRAVDLAREVGDREALSYVLKQGHGQLVLSADHLAERAALSQELMALASSPHATETKALALTTRIDDGAALGDRQMLSMAIAEYCDVAEALGQSHYRWCAIIYRGMLALADGRLPQAEASLERARALGQRATSNVRSSWLGAQLYILRREQGRLGELENAVRELAAAHPSLVSWQAALAYLLLEYGDPEEARELLHAHRDHVEHVVGLPRDFRVTVDLFGEVAARLGERSAARTLYDALLPWDGQQIVVGPSVAVDGCASRTLGLLAHALGAHQRAEAHFVRAIEADTAFGARPAVAYATAARAEALFATRGREETRRAGLLLESAREIALSVGMPKLMDRIVALEHCSALDCAPAGR